MHDFVVTEEFVNTANVAQLHSEARGSLPADQWPASFVFVDNGWAYRVERDDTEDSVVEAALASHSPDPNFGRSDDDVALDALRKKTTLTESELAEAIRLLVQKLIGPPFP
jgi:hypothetical protein